MENEPQLTIITICAWHEETPPKQLGIAYTHGICGPCEEKFMENRGVKPPVIEIVDNIEYE